MLNSISRRLAPPVPTLLSIRSLDPVKCISNNYNYLGNKPVHLILPPEILLVIDQYDCNKICIIIIDIEHFATIATSNCKGERKLFWP